MKQETDYRQARIIRNTGLGDLISRNLMSDRGLGSSIGKAVSDKFKAKVTGVKEKFDPLNIARKLTGNVGATILGKMTGRSKGDISYFTGIMGSRKNEDPLYTKISDGQSQRMRRGDALADVLAKLYNMTKQYHEDDVRHMQLENNFREERQAEKEKWQNELLQAMVGLGKKSNLKPTAVKEETESGVDFLPSNLLRALGAFFTGPIGATLLAVAVATYMVNKLAEATPDMSKIGPAEAAAVLQQGTSDEIKKEGGREYLENIVKNGKKTAQTIKDMPEGTQEEKDKKNKAILAAGGMKKIDEILADNNTYNVPENVDEGPDKVPARPDTSRGQNLARAKKWDERFGKDYDASGQKKSYSGPMRRLTPGVEPSEAGAGRGIAQMADYERSQTPDQAVFGKYPNMKPNVTPMASPNELTSKMQDVISRNNDLRMDESTAGQTIVIDNSKSINRTVPGEEVFNQPGSVPVRNDEDTLNRVFRKNLRPV